MASNSLESRSEMEGAKRLLKVVQKWNKSAAAMLLAMPQPQDLLGGVALISFAKLQVSNSEEEVKVAEGYLREVEQRWQVIDVDGNEPPSTLATSTSHERGETMTATQNINNSATLSPSSSNQTSTTVSSSSSINQTSTNFDDVIIMDPGDDNASEATKVKNVAMQSATLDLSHDNDNDVPYKIAIQGCGVSDVNGTFTLAGFHDDVPRYSMTKNDGYYHSYYIIQRDTIAMDGYVYSLHSDYKEEKRWLILEHKKDIGRGDHVCHYTARADDTRGELPPLSRWKTAPGVVNIQDGKTYRGNKRLPSPKLSHESMDAAYPMNGEIVNEFAVQGCGTGEINGVYKRNGYYNGGPSYFKTRSADGVPCVHIYRSKYCERDYHYWYISVLQDDHWLDYYRTVDISMESLSVTTRWKSMHHRGAYEKPVVKAITVGQTEEQSQGNKRIRY